MLVVKDRIHKGLSGRECFTSVDKRTSTYEASGPASKNDIGALEFDSRLFIGFTGLVLGSTYLYTKADSLIIVDSTAAQFSISIDGDEHWNGDFKGMNSLSRLEVGYYGDLHRYPFHNPAKGGLDWGGEGRGCNGLDGSSTKIC